MVGVIILVVGGLYLAACIWLARRLTSSISKSSFRSFLFTGIAVILFLLPLSDALWGYMQLKRLCAQESQTLTFAKLPLPSALFDTRGGPAFLEKNGNVNWPLIGRYLDVRFEESRQAQYPSIRRQTVSYVRRSDGKDIAKQINFHYDGGWFRVNGGGIGASNCLAPPSPDELVKALATKAS